jgi:DNA-binding transcriptional regulator YiaG
LSFQTSPGRGESGSPLLIKKLRKRLKITQGELAALVCVSTRAVGSWE